jgi:hypothetical protein
MNPDPSRLSAWADRGLLALATVLVVAGLVLVVTSFFRRVP